jgi:hypothetical protein
VRADESEPLFVKAKAELARIEKEEVLLQALEVAIGTGAARVISTLHTHPTAPLRPLVLGI